MNRRYTVLALPILLLVACGDSGDDDDERTASGEVLEGTIGDAELPLAELSSQPPLAKAAPTAGAAEAEASEEVEDAASLDAEQPAIENAVE